MMIQDGYIEVKWVAEGQMAGSCRDNEPVKLIYGDTQSGGYSPMELLLVSLASCSGATTVSILQKKRKQVDEFMVTASGKRRQEPPSAFEHITLDFFLKSADASEADLQRAIQLSEEKYCPVWAMLKGNVSVTTNFTISK